MVAALLLQVQTTVVVVDHATHWLTVGMVCHAVLCCMVGMCVLAQLQVAHANDLRLGSPARLTQMQCSEPKQASKHTHAQCKQDRMWFTAQNPEQ
jgi:hypothetical protein